MNDTPAIPLEELMRHRPWVRSLARRLVLDDAQVDDIEQLTWLAAIRRPPRRIGVLAWLNGVVRNLASKERRSEVRRLERQASSINAGMAPATADVVADAEHHELLVHAIRSLKEPYRTTLLLRYFEGLPPREIASRMAVPADTVRVRTRRALEMLRHHFDTTHGSRQVWMAAFVPLASGPDPGLAAAVAASEGHRLLSPLLMSTSTKLVASATLFASIVWFAWPDTIEDQHGTTESLVGSTTLDSTETNQAADVIDAEASLSLAAGVAVREPIQEDPAFITPPVQVGSWLQVTRTDNRGALPPKGISANFIDTSGLSHMAAGEQGDVEIPGSLAGPAVLWLTTLDDGALHRFGARTYPEGTTTLDIRASTPLDLRFVTESGLVLSQNDVEQRYAKVGIALAASWVESGRFAGDNPLIVMLTPPADDLWLKAATFAWQDSTTLRVTNTPSEGKWRLLLMLAQAPPVLLDVPEVQSGMPRTLEVRVSMSPSMQTVRFVDSEDGTPLRHSRVTPYYEHGSGQAFFAGTVRTTDSNGELLFRARTDPALRTGNSSWLLETDTHLGLLRERELIEQAGVFVRSIERKAIIRGNAYTPTGEPAVGGLVVHMEGGYVRRTKVDQDGRYELRGVLTQDRVGLILVTNFETMEVQQARAYVESGDEIELDIGQPMPPGTLGTVSGRITAGGQPVVGAMVAVEALDTEEAKSVYSRTDKNGDYVLSGVSPGRAHLRVMLGDFRVSNDYWLNGNEEPFSLGAGEIVTRDFALPGGVITVQVLDAAGMPLAGIDVCVEPEEAGLAASDYPGFRFHMGWSGKSDANGHVSLRGLLRGAPMRVFGRDHSKDWTFERRQVFAVNGADSETLILRKEP